MFAWFPTIHAKNSHLPDCCTCCCMNGKGETSATCHGYLIAKRTHLTSLSPAKGSS